MGAVSILRRQPPAVPPGSAERAALADLVTAKREADARRVALQQAHEAAQGAVQARRDAVERAEAAIATAKAEAANYLVAQRLGTAGEAPTTIKEARAHLVDAQDDLAAAMAAADTLAAQLEETASNAVLTLRTKEAAEAVVRAEAAEHARAVAAEVARLERELIRAGNELMWFVARGAFPRHEQPGVGHHRLVDSDIAMAVNRFESPPMSWGELYKQPDLRTDLMWSEVLLKLQLDPAAPLPIVK